MNESISGSTGELDVMAPAVFSDETPPIYRWLLRRDIDLLGRPPLVSCGYNPSAAGFVVNDPTIRREIGFCKSWGFSTLLKTNAMCAINKSPDALALLDDPVGHLADAALEAAAAYCETKGGIMLATWGAPKGRARTKQIFAERLARIRRLGIKWHVVKTDAGGAAHPLYLPSNSIYEAWEFSG